MKKSILVLICTLMALASFAGSTTTYYYSKITVKAESGRGVVYASESADVPDTGMFQESMTCNVKSENKNTDVYLFAKPVIDGEVFKYWLDGNGNSYTGSSINVEGSDTENTPKEYILTAVFGSPSAVTVESNDNVLGTATIDNPDNKIGDTVTLTASLAEPWAGGMGSKKWSKSHKFEGWYDSKGNLVSENTKFKFTIETPDTYTARFSWTPFVTGPGYYRVRWSYRQQFWTLSGSYDPTPGMFTTHDSRKLDGVLDLTQDNDFANPGAIMKLAATKFSLIDNYSEETVVAEGLSLEAQGVSTAVVLKGKTLKLQTCHNIGFYKILYSSYQIASSEHGAGTLGYLYVNSDQTGKSASDPDSYFEFEPVDYDHVDEFYFGAEPKENMEYDGGYWTSMYTAFPYECYAPDGVEAYYISELYPGDNMNIAVIKKIEDGIVPAYTAVLLKCKGLTARENRLIPLLDDPQPITDNLLNGEFQLAKSKNDPGKVTFVGDKMRVFSVMNGDLGFYKMAEDTELAANKVWLDISGITSNRSAKIVVRKQTSDVEQIVIDTNDGQSKIYYNLQGMPVSNPLPGQIYIINGKKVIL